MLTRIVAAALLVVACSDSEKAGVEEAKREAAEAAARKKATEPPPPPSVKPPVQGRAKLKCPDILDPAAYQAALGEKEPLALVAKSEPEAAASCSLMRGGKRPNEAEQKALKKNGRLGVLPGDELCNISLFCWTIEEPERFVKQCPLEAKGDHIEDTLGFKACIHINPTGEADVKRFRFFHDATRCVLQVRAGPSLVDNDLIGKCAKTAHDLIGPAQIAVKA